MSLEVLLPHLFDYAGMYPPANLSFADALRRSAASRSDMDRPGIRAADMVLDRSRVDDLTVEAAAEAGFGPEDVVTVCMVGVDADDAAEVAAEIIARNDAKRTEQPSQRIVSLEVGADQMGGLQYALHAARASLGSGVRIFLEPRFGPAGWTDHGPEVWALLDALNKERPRIGLKVRCAGDNALDTATLGHVLAGVAARDMPWKATQGLHHPLPFYNGGDNAHGFLNLSAAAVLVRAGILAPERIPEVLEDRDPSSFDLADGIRWRDCHVTEADLRAGGRMAPFTIGSCSLDEPDRELVELFGSSRP